MTPEEITKIWERIIDTENIQLKQCKLFGELENKFVILKTEVERLNLICKTLNERIAAKNISDYPAPVKVEKKDWAIFNFLKK